MLLCLIVADAFKLCNLQNRPLREMNRLNGGIDALVEKGPVQTLWQNVKDLVMAE